MSSLFRAIIFSVACLLAISPAVAQEDVPEPSEVEMPSFDGSALEPVTLTYEMSFSGGPQSSTGSATVTISEAEVDGQPTWRIVNKSDMGPGGTGVLQLDRSTLLPLSYQMEDGDTELTYGEDSVTGTMTSGPNQSTSVDLSLDSPVLDGRSDNLELALASLSLEEDQTIHVRTLSPFDPAVSVTTCTVTGTETVEVAAGSFETFVVSTETSGDGPSSSGTLHLRSEAPHYVIQGELTVETPQGSFTISRELTNLEMGAE